MFLDNSSFKAGDENSQAGFALHAASIFHLGVMAVLLVADAILITLHTGLGLLLLSGTILSTPDILRIDRDWSVGETFNYLKWLTLIGISIALFSRQKAPIFLSISIICIVALLDDSMQFHERFGGPLTGALAPGLNLPRGTGEMVFMAFEGMLIAAPLIYGWRRASSKVRRQIVPLLALFGGAIFCAAVIDFLHSQATGPSVKGGILGTLEDGGEMVFLSLMVSYATGLLLRSKPAIS